MGMFGRACRRWLTGLVTCARRALGAYFWARPAVRAHAAGTGVCLSTEKRV